MIPILYDRAEKHFTTNGIGRLSDCISCTVTEERNGIYECEFKYPITGEHYSDIKEDMIIAVTHDNKGDIQPFDIYARSAEIDGVVTFYAHHVSYRLSDVVVAPFDASGVADALRCIGTEAINYNEFTFWTNKTGTAEYKNKVPNIARAMLGGQEGSILDVFGTGDYEFDKFLVRLYANRGSDSGVEIRYGKNLADIEQKYDISSTYNAVVPYWTNPDGEVKLLPEYMIVYPGATVRLTTLTDEDLVIIRNENYEPIEVGYRIIDAIPMDLSSDFQEEPTDQEMRDLAQSRFESNEGWLPDENINVDFVQLWQTEEYANFAPLQRVGLCDTVSVYYPELGVEKVKTKVIKVVYNVLTEQYDSIELGKLQTTLAQTITSDARAEILQEVPTYDALEREFDLIRGGLGGYVVMNVNANGQPQEILIMDDPDRTQAVNVIRMNKNGIGFSQNGYNGPFNSAWTIDGTFYADWIKTGLLSDANGVNQWNMSTGQLITKSIRAIDYIYMNGTSNAFFQFPYATIGYLRLSSSGLRIQVRDSFIENATLYYSGGQTGDLPYDILIGTLAAEYEENSDRWRSFFAPTEFAVFHYSGGSTVANSRLQAGYLHVSRSSSYQFEVKTSDGQFYAQCARFLVSGDFQVTGTKNRKVSTDDYDNRLLYSYETASPMFGDIGEAVLDSDGLCFVDIDDIFSETISDSIEYQVFLQKEGQGDCWIAEKHPRYFVIEGTPNLKVAWELKAKQLGYELLRLEDDDIDLDEYENINDDILNDYINEQEELINDY